ncbi:MAG: hypothetical protein EXR52_08750 [Dehalococcoidia bacterium]|nr:hypothetical protein [Dehalococcoidia bacterium]
MSDISLATTVPSHHTYGRELRRAVVAALVEVPAVSLIAYLQYVGVQGYFVRVSPHTPEAIAQVAAAVQAVVGSLRPEIATKVECRVLSPDEPLPSSTVEFRRAKA